ncbi:amidoligase family protein [Adlercreutzia sp. ZJ138]|uniref:amidoligase family protein n=1 Tax=Adlercreutzia sp. ZJ138 TaxID=2709405 RepID=UPI0013EB0787|nr:amidoligase family protein [Adlercreutzia sp. ZJ138]
MSYSFKPEPVFHDIEGGDPSGLYLGVELEMDCGNAEATAKRISEAYGPQVLYFKHDGSLDDGCELVTHPMSPEYMASDAGKEMWHDICTSALAEGMRSHDTNTCGLHVHVSREFFGKSKTSQELTELKLIETVDRLFEPIVIFSRRKRHCIDRWAPKCNAPKEDAGWIKKAKRVSSFAKRDRYHAVNVTNDATIEFRLFRGTLKPETILATLQFVTGFCYLVKASNPSQMDRYNWYDLCDAVINACPVDTTELHNYLIERELIVPEGDFSCA